MKLYAPSYYPTFRCIADKCSHSCCIGWEIDIDSETLAAYENMTHPYGETIRTSISRVGDPHFRLAPGDRCPHLNGRGLCEIILKAGESYLCEICREHPRFYHETSRGLEVGLGMACEEACRIILSAEKYADFVQLSEEDGEPQDLFFDTLSHREQMYAILSNKTVPYDQRLEEISRVYNVSPKAIPDIEWHTLLDGLEYLNGSHKELFACYSSHTETPPNSEQALERTLAYLIFRHLTPAEDMEDLRARLGFCLFCERLLASMIYSYPGHSIPDLARIFSEELEYSTDNTETLKSMFF